MKPLPQEEPISDVHAFRDSTGRHPKDSLLRKNRFKIVERKRGCEAVWGRDGQRYTQSQAEAICLEAQRDKVIK
jgi:hypothetical protein